MKTFRTALLFIALASLLRAGVSLSLQETGSDVILTGSGTINTLDLGAPGSASWSGSVKPSAAWAVVGASGNVWKFDASSAPANIGPGTTIALATSNTGNVFGFYGTALYVPFNYVSGSSLNGSSTFAGETFASLGLTPGTYTWSWGSGPNADSATLTVGAPIPEPATAALLAGAFVLGLAGLRRSRRASR